MVGDSSTLENREGEAWQPTHMYLVGSQTRGGTDRIVAYKFALMVLFISVVLELVDGHCQHLDHRVVYTSYSTVAVWVVGAGGEFSNPQKLIYGVRKLGGELEAVVRGGYCAGAPRKEYP